MKYKLIVIDVDGTLLNEKNVLSKRTIYTLRTIQQMGIQIVLASGRPTYGLVPIAKMLELDKYGGFILSYNGCKIIDMKNKNIIFERRINRELLPYVEKISKKRHLSIFTYKRDEIITNEPGNKHIIDEANLNCMKVVDAVDFSQTINFNPYKCVLVSDDEQVLITLKRYWEKRLNGSMEAFLSESYFLEIVPPLISKANALGILLKELNIGREETMAFGNNICDITMIQLAGLGVAMGNASEAVKICADVTTASNKEDGVAIAIEKIILSNIRHKEILIDQLNAQSSHTLVGNLGITYTYISEDRIEATMPVDYRTRQPFGILHGGATLALAETLAGLGSMILCKPDESAVGMQVSGNHISSAYEGDTVRAVATIIHCGRSTHLWNVDVFTSTNKLVSSIRVINGIIKKDGI